MCHRSASQGHVSDGISVDRSLGHQQLAKECQLACSRTACPSALHDSIDFAMQIPVDVTDDDLNALFSPYGQVVEVHRHNKPGQPIGAQQ